MPRDDAPPYFKPWRPPRSVKTPATGGQKARISPRLRGLGPKWDALSIRFRKANPFCRFCEQEGMDTLGDVTDHIIPRRHRPELTMDWSNLQTLCKQHHDSLKERMERAADKLGTPDVLVEWCEDPSSRPVRLQSEARKALGEKK